MNLSNVHNAPPTNKPNEKKQVFGSLEIQNTSGAIRVTHSFHKCVAIFECLAFWLGIVCAINGCCYRIYCENAPNIKRDCPIEICLLHIVICNFCHVFFSFCSSFFRLYFCTHLSFCAPKRMKERNILIERVMFIDNNGQNRMPIMGLNTLRQRRHAQYKKKMN